MSSTRTEPKPMEDRAIYNMHDAKSNLSRLVEQAAGRVLKLLIDTHIALWTLAKPEKLPVDLMTWAEGAGINLLPIKPAHCIQVDRLPYRINPRTGRAHADPFDRMLVAQALAEPMRLVTADPLVALHEIDAPGLIEKIST